MNSTTTIKLSAGQQFAGYTLKALRGSGPVGVVWEAENEEKELRALKFCLCSDDVSRQELRAIQLVSRLEHPNLLGVEKVWTQDKYFVVATRLADGSLQDYFDAYQSEYQRGIDAAELCQLLGQVGSAIDFLNMQKHHLGSWPAGIQHCNLKPTNLLLFGDVLKVADFGMASPTTRMVQFGRRLTDPGFTAPEVFHGRLTNWTDQFSLAAVYVYLRGGRPPFASLPEPGQVPYVRPAPDLSMLTEKERPVVARAMASNPTDRWKTCQEFFSSLTAAVKS